MRLLLSIDRMASRYGLLPSQVVERATTYDLVILDAAMHYEYIQEYRANHSGQSPPIEYSAQELESMIKRARAK